jgi:hypothetical protein
MEAMPSNTEEIHMPRSKKINNKSVQSIGYQEAQRMLDEAGSKAASNPAESRKANPESLLDYVGQKSAPNDRMADGQFRRMVNEQIAKKRGRSKKSKAESLVEYTQKHPVQGITCQGECKFWNPPGPNEPRWVYRHFGPDAANHFLECHSAGNRPKNEDHIKSFEKHQRNGTFVQGMPTGFTGERRLADSQHRMESIRRTGIGAKFLVCYDLTEAEAKVMNSGRSNSLADSLGFERTIYKPRLAAPRLRELSDLIGCDVHGIDAYARLYMRFKPSFDWAGDVMACKGKKVAVAPIAAAFILAHSIFPDATKSFFQRVVNMDGRGVGDPALTLCKYLHGPRPRESERAQSLRVLRCIQADMRGERLTRTVPNEAALEFFTKGRV